ncbi:MAG: hypothetical protein K5885_01575 [Bacteroidales bacterium]|nr:hypothetical protein [Bacteroidales bacterium]
MDSQAKNIHFSWWLKWLSRAYQWLSLEIMYSTLSSALGLLGFHIWIVLWSIVPFFFPNLVLQYYSEYYLFVFIGVLLVVISLSVIDHYTIKSSAKKKEVFLSYAGESFVKSIENLKRVLPMVLVVAIALLHTMIIVAFFMLSLLINAKVL